MTTLLTVITFIALIGLIVGLYKPSLITKNTSTTRKDVGIRLGALFVILLCCLLISLKSPTEFSQKNMTLTEYKQESNSNKHDIVEEYIAFNKIPDKFNDDFYTCLSEYSYSKSGDLNLGSVLDWCKTDYQKDPNILKNMVNMDNFESQFSAWDGSNRNLEKLIKASMNDEDSYEHISTKYNLVLDKPAYAIVTTEFRGKNGYGAKVKQQITAKVDVKSGEVIEIIS